MRTDLLLDTCAAIWMTEGMALSEVATNEIDEAYREGRRTYVSPMTAWERGMLVTKGRIASSISPQRWFSILISELGFTLFELSPELLIDSCFLPGDMYGDPVDRILVATARFNDLTIVTRDRLILDYAKMGHVRALAC
jgi:PIN domain nuclease of toxin-antitoxin system